MASEHDDRSTSTDQRIANIKPDKYVAHPSFFNEVEHRSGACHHVFSNGAHCLGNAVKGNSYCRWHVSAALREARREAYTKRPAAAIAGLEIPYIEDPSSMQIAIHQVLDAIIDGRVTDKRGWFLLYGLQIAQRNIEGKLKLPALNDNFCGLPDSELNRLDKLVADARRRKNDPAPSPRNTPRNKKKSPQSAPVVLPKKEGTEN